jgi:hypothetical protein
LPISMVPLISSCATDLSRGHAGEVSDAMSNNDGISRDQSAAALASRSLLERRGSEELVKIWRDNDSSSWGPNVFVTIKSILLSRNIELPEQLPPPQTPVEISEDIGQKTRRYQKIGILIATVIAVTAWTIIALSPLNTSQGKLLDWKIDLILLSIPLIGMAIGRMIARR